MKTNEVPDTRGQEASNPCPLLSLGLSAGRMLTYRELRGSREGFPEIYAGRKGQGLPRH